MPINDEHDMGMERDFSVKNGVGIINKNIDLGTNEQSGTIVLSEQGDGVIHKTVFTCTAVPIVTADEAGQGQYGGVKIYTFPAGLISTIGAVIDGDVTLTEASWKDTWEGDIGLGIITPADQQNGLTTVGSGAILQSTAVAAATAQVAAVPAFSIATALTEAGSRVINGTSTPVPLWLNLLVDDDAAHVDGAAGTFTGTITVVWTNCGDIA
jgi:hypothetical protein